MIGKTILALCFLFESLSKSLVNVNICDIAVLKYDTEECELFVQILDHLTSHISFKIKDLRKPDTVDKVSDTLIDLCV